MRILVLASTLLIGLTAPLAAAAPAKPVAAPTGSPIGKACEQEFTKRMGDVDALGKALSSGK